MRRRARSDRLRQENRYDPILEGEVLGGFPAHEERDQRQVAGEQGAQVGAVAELVVID